MNEQFLMAKAKESVGKLSEKLENTFKIEILNDNNKEVNNHE